MSGEISKVPVSLLSLLDMNSRGQAPRILAPEAVATLEITETYLQQGRQVIQAATNAVNATGFWLAFTVPDYTAYWFHGLSFGTAANLAATTNYRVRPAYTPDGDVTQIVTMPSTTDGNYTSGARPNMPADRVPRILMPGAAVGIWAETVSLGTAVQWIAWADITPLRV